MLTAHYDSDKKQGLGWVSDQLDNGDLIWLHGGGDPGIETMMLFRPSDGVGVIFFINAGILDAASGEGFGEVISFLLQESSRV